MPIMEMRDGITIMENPTAAGNVSRLQLDGNGFGIMQKKIQVQRRFRHKIEHCDFFIDTVGIGYSTAVAYLTPLPIIYSDMGQFTGIERGVIPAYNENVLFKARWVQRDAESIGNFDEFPNTFLAARPTFNFYSDTLYFTVFFYGEPNSYVDEFTCTIYAALNSKPIDAVEHGLGLLKERMTMLTSRIDALGRSIPPARNSGQIAPFWRYGGSRPELMITGSSLVNYFLNVADRDEEEMSDPTQLRAFVRLSRQMVENPDAFGTPQGGGFSMPDWVRMHLSEGIVAGAIRPQWPPLKHFDNGNVMML